MPSARVLTRYFAQDRGSVTLTTALASLLLFVCMGVAVDYLRLFHARTELQAALDSATLASAAKPGAMDQTATNYFNSNAASTLFTVSQLSFSKASDGTVNGTVSAELRGSFLHSAGFTPMRLKLASAARGDSTPSATMLNIKTLEGGGQYDKDLYVVVKDSSGKTVETLVQSYDYVCVCHSSGPPTFTPTKNTAVTITVPLGSTVSYKLVVFRDPAKNGNHWYASPILSNAVTSNSSISLSGQCTDAGGQTQSWNDGNSAPFKSLVVNVACTPVLSGKPKVALVR